MARHHCHHVICITAASRSIQDEGDRFVNKNVLAFGDEAEAGVPEIAVEKNELGSPTNGAVNVDDVAMISTCD